MWKCSCHETKKGLQQRAKRSLQGDKIIFLISFHVDVQYYQTS